MRAIKIGIGVFLVCALSLFLFYGSSMAQSAQKENHCFTCHTSARKLIKITREIAEANKDKPKAAKSEGEG